MRKATVARDGSILTMLLVTLFANSGCALELFTIEPVRPDLENVARSVPLQGRSHVYVFMLQGEDVLDLTNLYGVKCYLHSLGFNKIWLGHWHHVSEMKSIIRDVRCVDPVAHFVLIGNGHGAKTARDVANDLATEGIVFELVVYLGAPSLDDDPPARPQNAMKVLHFAGERSVHKARSLEQVEVVELSESSNFHAPTHPAVLDALVRELTRIAGSIEVEVDLGTLPMPSVQPPKPSKKLPPPQKTSAEWDFLEPTAPQ